MGPALLNSLFYVIITDEMLMQLQGFGDSAAVELHCLCFFNNTFCFGFQVKRLRQQLLDLLGLVMVNLALKFEAMVLKY